MDQRQTVKSLIARFFSEVPTPWTEFALADPDAVIDKGGRVLQRYELLTTDDERAAYLGLLVGLQRHDRYPVFLASTPKNAPDYIGDSINQRWIMEY